MQVWNAKLTLKMKFEEEGKAPLPFMPVDNLAALEWQLRQHPATSPRALFVETKSLAAQTSVIHFSSPASAPRLLRCSTSRKSRS